MSHQVQFHKIPPPITLEISALGQIGRISAVCRLHRGTRSLLEPLQGSTAPGPESSPSGLETTVDIYHLWVTTWQQRTRRKTSWR